MTPSTKPEVHRRIATVQKEERDTTIASMRKRFCEVPENFLRTEKQTDRQTNRQTCSSQHAAPAWPSAHGQIGSADSLEKWMKNQKAKTCKKSSFLCLCYILRAIRAGRCRERRYADHIFIQIYFRMHHFSTQLNSTENYGRRCLTPLSPHRNYILS